VCHQDSSYRHPGRRVARAALVLAALGAAALALQAYIAVVLAVVAALVVVAGVAKVVDVVGTRRAVAEHEALCAAQARERMRRRALEGARTQRPVALPGATVDRPAALEAAPPRLDVTDVLGPAQVPAPRAAAPRAAAPRSVSPGRDGGSASTSAVGRGPDRRAGRSR
jgi:hypothetical protein